MTWVDLLDDSRGIRAIFGNELPSFQGSALHSARLHRDGPTLKLVCDTRNFPSRPPRKWLGANTARIELWFTGVESVRIAIDAITEPIDLNIARSCVAGSDLIRVTGIVEGVAKIEATATRVHLSRISAHRC
ncbi:Imm50 family immunity protein [Nocardia sp. NPDC056064]|uniref:Imm50 family immunity protein n=1 Tax=Nocardia sp. NPDC056064 TaxID=3345701 RepID=UPI0035DB3CF5